MQKALIVIFLSSILVVAGCSNSSAPAEFNDEIPYTAETIEDTSSPTVVTELPTNTNEEVITQADTSL